LSKHPLLRPGHGQTREFYKPWMGRGPLRARGQGHPRENRPDRTGPERMAEREKEGVRSTRVSAQTPVRVGEMGVAGWKARAKRRAAENLIPAQSSLFIRLTSVRGMMGGAALPGLPPAELRPGQPFPLSFIGQRLRLDITVGGACSQGLAPFPLAKSSSRRRPGHQHGRHSKK